MKHASHPSYLELDRHFLGASLDPETARHVAACGPCQGHLARLAPPHHVPDWVVARSQARAARRRSRARWIGAGGLVALAACALLFFGAPPAAGPYIGAKGAPDVSVHVSRAGAATLWTGFPLQPGDRIRLEVTPQEFDQVAILSLDANSHHWALLYQGEVTPGQRNLLPKAWKVDATSSTEELAVAFSHGRLSGSEAKALLSKSASSELTLRRLTLPKQARASEAGSKP